jgi:hypothetical protein
LYQKALAQRLFEKPCGSSGDSEVGVEAGLVWQRVERLEGADGFLIRGQAATDADHTEVTLQADAALALEQWTLDGGVADAARFLGAGVRLVTDFQLEQCLQAVAQLFSALETQGIRSALADRQRLVRLLLDACIDRAVDLNSGLCMGSAGERADECNCHQRFFHLFVSLEDESESKER